MSLELTGKVIEIGPTQQVTERLRKREFVIDITDNPSYPNYAKLQTTQNKCEALDTVKVGDEIKVSFNVRGNRWEHDGKVNYITSLDAWKIEKLSSAAEPVYHNANGAGRDAQAPVQSSFDDSDSLPF